VIESLPHATVTEFAVLLPVQAVTAGWLDDALLLPPQPATRK
jgi:hypothetical protein